MKRRQAIATCLAGVGACILGRNVHSREPIPRSGPARFQVGLAAYSLRNYFSFMKGKAREPHDDGPAIDMRKFIDYCVNQGFETAELTSYFFPPNADEEYFKELREYAAKQNMPICGTAIGNNFTIGKGVRLDTEVEEAVRWINRAAILGAPHIRFFAGTKPQLDGHPERMDEAIEALERCAEHAAAKQIYLGVENHGRLTAEDCLTIMGRINNPWIGMNLDTGNFISNDPYGDLESCVGYAVNVQVKTTMKKPDGSEFPADLNRIGEILRNAKYQGAVVLEYEGTNPYEKIPEAHQMLRESLDRV